MVVMTLLLYLCVYVGTVVAMEKEAGILSEQHVAVIEGLRDKIETEFKQFRDGTHRSP